MKCLITVLFCTLVLMSCSTNDPSNAMDRDNFITIEATVITDTANAAIPVWYNDTYLPKMMEYSGLEGVYRIQTFMAIPITDSVGFLSGPLTMFMASSKDNLTGMSSSPQVAEANSAMATKWPGGEITRSWSVSYEKVKSWENPAADKPMQFVTMVPTVAAPGHEEEVNEWEINTHVPDQMKSENLARVVRFKKIAGSEVNVSGMSDYIELFYYADQASFSAHNPNDDQIMAAAEADREATWQDNELTFPWIYMGAIVKEDIK